MAEETKGQHPALWPLALAALGVVYGDIGTSPLYALRVCFGSGLEVNHANVLGVISLIIWALLLLITGKYLSLVLRADNRGEGGIIALMALVRRESRAAGVSEKAVVVLGLFGAALLYGDGLITPAISVLSAMEGLSVATTVLDRWIVPLSLAVLIVLFWVQHRGSRTVGTVFGPIMLVWFAVIGLLGLYQICQTPQVLAAFNPWYGLNFFLLHGWHGFIILGAVFLALTGGEALYADMGHFGKNPIRLGWYAVVLPGLLLNYLGQGGVLLQQPETANHLFYALAPRWALYPLVALATAATVIASQAIISGTFSLTRQAVQMGYSPRLAIIHTSAENIGQVYLPVVNWMMCFGTLALVVGFGASSRLAGAYGIAVSATDAITSLLLFFVMRYRWRWPLPLVLLVIVPFLMVDLSFFGSNLLKIREGGWVPITIAVGVLILSSTWYRGREILGRRFAAESVAMNMFATSLKTSPPPRVAGTAVFLTGNPHGVPRTLLHNFKHNKILHEHNILLTIITEEIPFVPAADRLRLEKLEHGFYRVILRYGFSDDPDIPAGLEVLAQYGLDNDPMTMTFFLGRETLLFSRAPTMQRWRKHIFAFLTRNARDAAKYFHIPPNRVVELGIQVEL